MRFIELSVLTLDEAPIGAQIGINIDHIIGPISSDAGISIITVKNQSSGKLQKYTASDALNIIAADTPFLKVLNVSKIDEVGLSNIAYLFNVNKIVGELKPTESGGTSFYYEVTDGRVGIYEVTQTIPQIVINTIGLGLSGYSGYSGANPGASGFSGISGWSGISGYSGYSGSGTSGYSGISGISGYSGFMGILPVNGNAGAIVLGTPVYMSANNTVDKAQANSLATSNVVGLVGVSSIASGNTDVIKTGGTLVGTTGQWDAITGDSGGLTFDSPYFLDPTTAGKLTKTAPSTIGQIVAYIGIAISTTEMKINILPRVRL